MALRGVRMLEAMRDTASEAGVDVVVSKTGFRNDAPLLMTYGTGHEIRRPYWQRQRARGGHCIGWDLGYWKREGDMRATLDNDHPPQFIRPEDGSRWDAQGIDLRNDADPNGPILLIGMGNKAARLHCGHPLNWEIRMFHKIRAAYPSTPIVFRPKGKNKQKIKGAGTTPPQTPIEEALKNVSLVVCRHSNVAVDACIAGVPVVCEDGAASALYSNDLKSPVAPSPAERLAFLRSLAWWNWQPSEAGAAWTYLLSRL